MSRDTEGFGSLVLPSLRAHIGDWVYYISFMKMQDIAERLNRSQLVYGSLPLQEFLQRQLMTGRSEDIKDYLVSQKQHFFNALVVGTSGGDPKWRDVVLTEKPEGLSNSFPEGVAGVQGFLTLNGTEKLFTIDGQHRVEGIREAVQAEPKLKDEQVCVILVKGITADRRELDPKGFERTRRLFTVLNRYAKPVGIKDIIALDEDDRVAITTRRLVNDYDLFKGKKISGRQTSAIPRRDKVSVTSIITLYQVLDLYFGGLTSSEKKIWRKKNTLRPPEKELNQFYADAEDFWDVHCKHFPPLEEVKQSEDEEEVAGKYRNENGGLLLFRPVGLLLLGKTVKRLRDLERLTLERAVSQLAKAPLELSDEPWKGLLWDSANRRMIAPVERQRAGEKMLFHALGGDLAKIEVDPEALRHELAGLMQVDPSRYRLPKYS